MPTDIEDRLGNVALQGKGPNSLLSSSNNPTNLMATYSSPISQLTAEAIQHRYETALGNSKSNAGPRIDDTQSFLYMVDFCFEKVKENNPFSDLTFQSNCGMCMTMGTTITGRSTDSNFGIVVYHEDKEYSRREGIDAVPSAHSATCAPLVKAEGAGPNVRSIAISAAQYEATKAYKQLNSYTVSKGTGAGSQRLTCGTVNNIPYVIKQGFSRDGEWDTKIEPNDIDYTRVNELDTTPFPQTCTESNSCPVTTGGRQWDMSARCGYPLPKEFTMLPSIVTSNAATFRWTGGEYGNPDSKILKDNIPLPINSGNNPITYSTGDNTITYSNLNPRTLYKVQFRLINEEGRRPENYLESNVTTLDDRDVVARLRVVVNVNDRTASFNWDGGTNAVNLYFQHAPQSTQYGNAVTITAKKVSKTHSISNLLLNTPYKAKLTASYSDGSSVNVETTFTT